jgi:hypothetical protein
MIGLARGNCAESSIYRHIDAFVETDIPYFVPI